MISPTLLRVGMNCQFNIVQFAGNLGKLVSAKLDHTRIVVDHLITRSNYATVLAAVGTKLPFDARQKHP